MSSTRDRFRSPEEPPEGLERELLEILIEECAEVQQRATKILRFGLEEVQPGQYLSNSTRLAQEIGDLEEVIKRLVSHDIIDEDTIAQGINHKSEQLQKYLQNDK